jgi:hypothetical protein
LRLPWHGGFDVIRAEASEFDQLTPARTLVATLGLNVQSREGREPCEYSVTRSQKMVEVVLRATPLLVHPPPLVGASESEVARRP